MTSTPETPIARWRARLGLSQRAAAQALGMSLPGYQQQERGARFDGRPQSESSRALLLACSAVEHELQPIE